MRSVLRILLTVAVGVAVCPPSVGAWELSSASRWLSSFLSVFASSPAPPSLPTAAGLSDSVAAPVPPRLPPASHAWEGAASTSGWADSQRRLSVGSNSSYPAGSALMLVFPGRTCLTFTASSEQLCWTLDATAISQPPAWPGYEPVELVSGAAHMCAKLHRVGAQLEATAPGAMVCWGGALNGQSQLLDAARFDAVSIAPGALHTCVLRATGAVLCWGDNRLGQCDVPAHVSSPASPVTALRAGYFHTCAVFQDRSIACWGFRTRDGDRNQPPADLRADSAANVSLSVSHACAIPSSGAAGMRCWGSQNAAHQGAMAYLTPNSGGALLIATAAARTCVARGTEFGCVLSDSAGRGYNIAPFFGSFAPTTAQQLHTSATHMCALLSNHSVACLPFPEARSPRVDIANVQLLSVGEQHLCTSSRSNRAAVTCSSFAQASVMSKADTYPLTAYVGAVNASRRLVCSLPGSSASGGRTTSAVSLSSDGLVSGSTLGCVNSTNVTSASERPQLVNMTVPASHAPFTIDVVYGACNVSTGLVHVEMLVWNATRVLSKHFTANCSTFDRSLKAVPSHATHRDGMSVCAPRDSVAADGAHLLLNRTCPVVDADYANHPLLVAGYTGFNKPNFVCSARLVARGYSAAVTSGAYVSSEAPFRSVCEASCPATGTPTLVGPPATMCDTTSSWIPATRIAGVVNDGSVVNPPAAVTACNVSTATGCFGSDCTAVPATGAAPLALLPLCLDTTPTEPSILSVSGCDAQISLRWRVSAPPPAVMTYLEATTWSSSSLSPEAAAQRRLLQTWARTPAGTYDWYVMLSSTSALASSAVQTLTASHGWTLCTATEATRTVCARAGGDSVRLVKLQQRVTETAELRSRGSNDYSLSLSELQDSLVALLRAGTSAPVALSTMLHAAAGSAHAPNGARSNHQVIVNDVTTLFETQPTSTSAGSMSTAGSGLPSTCARALWTLQNLVTLQPDATRLIVSDGLPPAVFRVELNTRPSSAQGGEVVTIACALANPRATPYLRISPASVVITSNRASALAHEFVLSIAYAGGAPNLGELPQEQFNSTTVQCRVSATPSISYSTLDVELPVTIMRGHWQAFGDVILELGPDTWRSAYSAAVVNITAAVTQRPDTFFLNMTEAERVLALERVTTPAALRPSSLSITLSSSTNITLLPRAHTSFLPGMAVTLGPITITDVLVGEGGRYARFASPALSTICPAGGECSNLAIGIIPPANPNTTLTANDLLALATDNLSGTLEITRLQKQLVLPLKCPPMCPSAPLPFPVSHARASGRVGASLQTVVLPLADAAMQFNLVATPELGSLPASAPLSYVERCSAGLTQFTDPASGACTNVSHPQFSNCAFGQGDSCKRCMDGALCPGGSRAWPQLGFWTPSELSGIIVACAAPADLRCQGWNASMGSVICGEGYSSSSPACGACAPGYYRQNSDGSCRTCPSGSGFDVLVLPLLKLLGGVAGGVGLVVMPLLYWRAKAMGKNMGWVAKRAIQFLVLSFTSIQATVTVGRAAQPGMPAAMQTVYNSLNVFQFEGLTMDPACIDSAVGPYLGQIVELSMALGFAVVCASIGAVGGCMSRHGKAVPNALRGIAKLCMQLENALYAVLMNCALSMLNCRPLTTSVDSYLSMNSDYSKISMLPATAGFTVDFLRMCRDSPFDPQCTEEVHAALRSPVDMYTWGSNPNFVCFEGDHKLPAVLSVAALVVLVLLYPLFTFLYSYYRVASTVGQRPWSCSACALIFSCKAFKVEHVKSRAEASPLTAGKDVDPKRPRSVEDMSCLFLALDELDSPLQKHPEIQPFVNSVFQAVRFYFVHINFYSLVGLGAVTILWPALTTPTMVIAQCLSICAIVILESVLLFTMWPFKDDEFHIGITQMYMSGFAIFAAATNAVGAMSGLDPSNATLASALTACSWILVVIALGLVVTLVYAFYVVLTPNRRHGIMQRMASMCKCTRAKKAMMKASGELPSTPAPTPVFTAPSAVSNPMLSPMMANPLTASRPVAVPSVGMAKRPVVMRRNFALSTTDDVSLPSAPGTPLAEGTDGTASGAGPLPIQPAVVGAAGRTSAVARARVHVQDTGNDLSPFARSLGTLGHNTAPTRVRNSRAVRTAPRPSRASTVGAGMLPDSVVKDGSDDMV